MGLVLICLIWIPNSRYFERGIQTHCFWFLGVSCIGNVLCNSALSGERSTHEREWPDFPVCASSLLPTPNPGDDFPLQLAPQGVAWVQLLFKGKNSSEWRSGVKLNAKHRPSRCQRACLDGVDSQAHGREHGHERVQVKTTRGTPGPASEWRLHQTEQGSAKDRLLLSNIDSHMSSLPQSLLWTILILYVFNGIYLFSVSMCGTCGGQRTS